MAREEELVQYDLHVTKQVFNVMWKQGDFWTRKNVGYNL